MTTNKVGRLTFGRSKRIAATASLRFGSVMTVAAVAGLLLPALTVVLVSFSSSGHFQFPPPGFSLDHYASAFNNPVWMTALGLSVQIAIPVALISALVGAATVLALHRSSMRGGTILQFAASLPLVMPISAYAIAMYAVYAQFKIVGTFGGVVVAYVVLALPLTLAILAASFSRVPLEFELAAMTAGASRTRAWVQITGRLLLPALVGSMLLAFLVSFDEAVMVNFIGGPGQTTLPKAVLDTLKVGLDPAITAVATMLMVGTAVLVFLIEFLRGRGVNQSDS